MQYWKLPLAAAILTLSLSSASLAAPTEMQPNDTSTPQSTEITERDERPDLVAAPVVRDARQEPRELDNSPESRDRTGRRGPGAPVLDLELNSNDMSVKQR